MNAKNKLIKIENDLDITRMNLDNLELDRDLVRIQLVNREYRRYLKHIIRYETNIISNLDSLIKQLKKIKERYEDDPYSIRRKFGR